MGAGLVIKCYSDGCIGCLYSTACLYTNTCLSFLTKKESGSAIFSIINISPVKAELMSLLIMKWQALSSKKFGTLNGKIKSEQ